MTRQTFAPKCLEKRQEGSQVWWSKTQQWDPWFHFGNIHLHRRRCRFIFRHQIRNWMSPCHCISLPAELYWLPICSGSSSGKLSRFLLRAACQGKAPHFKGRRERGERVKCWCRTIKSMQDFREMCIKIIFLKAVVARRDATYFTWFHGYRAENITIIIIITVLFKCSEMGFLLRQNTSDSLSEPLLSLYLSQTQWSEHTSLVEYFFCVCPNSEAATATLKHWKLFTVALGVGRLLQMRLANR